MIIHTGTIVLHSTNQLSTSTLIISLILNAKLRWLIIKKIMRHFYSSKIKVDINITIRIAFGSFRQIFWNRIFGNTRSYSATQVVRGCVDVTASASCHWRMSEWGTMTSNSGKPAHKWRIVFETEMTILNLKVVKDVHFFCVWKDNDIIICYVIQ